MPEAEVAVEWVAWSDAGGGLSRGIPITVLAKTSWRVMDLWQHLPDTEGAPKHYARLWCVRGGRFMHDQMRTLESYGVSSNDTLYALLRCAAPLID